jgi:hypothetical protein
MCEELEDNSLLAEYAAILHLPPALDPILDVTASALAAATGRDRNKVHEFLKAQEKAGILVSHQARGEKGQTVTAFRRVIK